MINVKFENPPGTVLTTRQFDPGQPITVGAYITGALSLPEPFMPVDFELYGVDNNFTPYFTSTRTTIQGNAWVDWNLPNVITKATVRITAHFFSGDEYIEIPIGIGVAPPPITPGADWSWILVAGVILVVAAFAYSKGKK